MKSKDEFKEPNTERETDAAENTYLKKDSTNSLVESSDLRADRAKAVEIHDTKVSEQLVLSGQETSRRTRFDFDSSGDLTNPEERKNRKHNDTVSLMVQLQDQINDRIAALDSRIQGYLQEIDALMDEINDLQGFIDEAADILKKYDDGDGEFDREAAIALLKERGIEVDENMSPEQIIQLLTDEVTQAQENIHANSEKVDALTSSVEDMRKERDGLLEIQEQLENGEIDEATVKQKLHAQSDADEMKNSEELANDAAVSQFIKDFKM